MFELESKYLLDTEQQAAGRGGAVLLCNILQRAGLSLQQLSPQSAPVLALL